MQKTMKKTMAILLTTLFILSATASITLLPITYAHNPALTIPTWAYLSVMPNPVGIGQEAFVNFWIDKAPPTAATIYGDRWQNFKVTVTKPDGTTETLGPFTADDTGGAHTTYTPNVLGNYTFQMSFPGQTLTGANPPPAGYSSAISALIGDYYSGSTSPVVTLVVQQEQIPGEFTNPNPIPTQYWQRPIYAENLDWYKVGGNWLGLGAVGFTRATGAYNASGNFNPYTTAPTTGHILWTKALAPGGIIGGEFGGNQAGSSYYSTSQYEPKFGGIIINGVLYYQFLPGASPNPAGWEALNLRTGQELWFKSTTEPLLCGQVLDYISPNQFGGLPYLWSTQTTVSPNIGTTYGMYDAMTGNYILSIVNGTSFTLVEDDGGNLIGYYVNSSNPNAPTLNMWNSTQCIITGTNGPAAWQWRPTQNAQIAFSKGIMWSMPIATNVSGASFSPGLSLSAVGAKVLLLTSVPTALSGGLSWQPGWRIIAGYSTTTGQLLWGPLNQTLVPWVRLDTYGISNDMWFEFDHENLVWSGYNANTGQKLWTSDPYNSPPWAYFVNYRPVIAYGNLYASDFGGQVHAYDITTGKQVWQFSTGSSGYSTPYGIWPLVHVEAVAGGEVFLSGGHTYSPPLFLGAQLYVLNATTGDKVWSISSFDDSNAASAAIADGIFVKPNAYDNQLYAYGQGQTATTVTAPDVAVPEGTPVVIRGTVTDQSAGQTCLGIPAKGTAAISDDSMTAWMEYLYMQQSCPNNATGVPVSINVLDSNGNYRQIGTATSDASGMFTYTWTPDIPGDFTIIAIFAGSQSYYSSSAESSFHVIPAAAPTSTVVVQTNYATTSDLMMYVGVAAVGIIIAIAIATILLLRKRP
jgi:outer membrane protein assembly factor BamB